MGLTALESLDEIIAVNRRNYEQYQREFADLDGLKMVTYDAAQKNNYQYVILEVDNDLEISRDELVSILHAENVMARRYFYPGCHRMEPYRSYYPHAGLLLPHTEALTERVFSLPTGTSIDSDAIEAIGQIVRVAVTGHREVRARLERRANKRVPVR
jgi:dTDP-4-amino-4,6-dideoxygalactose transaminase